MMKRLIILLVVSFLLSACKHKSRNPHADKFYTDKGGFDFARFPLIKPYEAANTILEIEWIISSVDENEVLGTLPGPKYINVVDSVIFAYGKNTIVDGQRAREGWFVIIPKSHIFRGFTTNKGYLDYLSSIGVYNPKTYNVEEIFQYFQQNDTLNWQKLNKDN